jgi:heptosyltransferase I
MFWKRSDPLAGLIDPRGNQRILLIKLTSLGDVIHALPVASRLKTNFPRIKLFWVVEDRCAPILEAHPLLDGIVVYPRKKIQALLARKAWGQALGELGRLRRALRELRADLSIDLQGLAKSGLMALLTGAPARWGCSGSKELSYLISRTVPEGGGLHAVDRNLKVAEFLGCPPGPPDFRIGLRAEERAWADHFLETQGVMTGKKIIGLQVGASLPQKCWPLKQWGSLLQGLAHWKEVQVVLLGDEQDRQRFGGQLPISGPGAIDGLGRMSLRQVMAVLERCRLVVGSDTGPLHLAVALGVPVVGLYGPDDPRFTGPYGAGNKVHYKKLPCSPCYKNPTCQGRFDCLQAIEAAEVFESLRELLAVDDRQGEAF